MAIGSANQFATSFELSKSLENISTDTEKDYWVEVDAPNSRRPHNVNMRTVSEKELLDRADAIKLHAIIKTGDVQGVNYFIQAHGPHLINIKNKDGMTALYVAISGSCIPNRDQIISTLMEFKPNVNAATNSGNTPVKAAVEFGRHHDVVSELIKAGANVDQRDGQGMTARSAYNASNRASLKNLFGKI